MEDCCMTEYELSNQAFVPKNRGKKWTDDEEKLLMKELRQNINIETIAQTHERTVCGINFRRKEIAYRLYVEKVPLSEISNKTKLNECEINEAIIRGESRTKIQKLKIEEKFSFDKEITSIKKDIGEIKNTLNELMVMMNAIYEFETS